MLSDIENLTHAQLLLMTPRQIADLRWKGEEYVVGVGQWDEAGRMTVKTVTTRQVLGDAKTGSRTWEFVYFATGDINTITERVFDENDNQVGRRVIKHYKDGRPPVVTAETGVMKDAGS